MATQVERNKQLLVKLSAEELADLSARAKRHYGNTSEMVRALLAGEDVVIVPMSMIRAGRVADKEKVTPGWAAEVIKSALDGPPAPRRDPDAAANEIRQAPPAGTPAAVLASLPGHIRKDVVVGIPTPDHSFTVVDPDSTPFEPTAAPPVPEVDPDAPPTDAEYEQQAIDEFGIRLIARCPKELQGWKRMTWPQRIETLREKKQNGD